ncbi:MAG: LysR family transcriptional regulator [Arenibacterium sp.]
MTRARPHDTLSLKALDLFQLCAQQGSLQAAALETGLSVSTISHHLRSLEEQLGVELFNHSRRPMVLTPKGRAFLRNIDEALYAIRRAKAEASAGNSSLRLGTIEDFDSDIIPELAVFLSRTMPRCDMSFHTDTSHRLIEMLRNRQLDLGISTTPSERTTDLQERPLLRDPFIAVLPLGMPGASQNIADGKSELPLLRFSGNQIIARQIDAHLRRLGLPATRGFESSNNQTLMAMVASGAGWTISTPLLYSRARRFHDRVRIQSFPGKPFSRTLSILSTPDCARSMVELVEQKTRGLIEKHLLKPLIDNEPWLAGRLELLD